MLCNHCGNPAQFTFENTGAEDQFYCRKHVPVGYGGHPNLKPYSAPTEEVEPEPKPVPKPRPTRRRKSEDPKE